MRTLSRKTLFFSTTALVLGSLAFISNCNATSFDPGLRDQDAMRPVKTSTQSVDVKKYQQTEAEFVKTAHKLEKAQAKHQNTDAIMADFVDLGRSLNTQAQQGAQAELMSKELTKSTHTTSIKDKFESAKQSVKKIFTSKAKSGAEDSREALDVLCLDGGGVRGIGTLLMLVDLEMRTGKKTYEMFDRIYGTSTGGLMAILLAKGMAATEVLDIYFDNMDKIFYRSWGDALKNPAGLFSAQYNPAGLESIINKYAGSGTLKDVKIPVAVTCVDKATQKVKLLSSDSEKTKDVKILEAARATSAAPTYFPAQEVNVKGKKFMAVDGGVGANNPAEEALEDIKKKFGAQYKVNMLSLGTGVEEKVKISDNAGKLGFGNPANIPAYFMGTNEANIEKRVKKAHKNGEINEYNRFNFELPFKIDLADTSEKAKNALLQLAFKRTQQDDFKGFVNKMREKYKHDFVAKAA